MARTDAGGAIVSTVPMKASTGQVMSARAATVSPIGMPPESIEKAAIGTPAQVAERLSEHAAAGAQLSYLQLLEIGDLDHVALIAAEVMPQLA